MSSLIERISNLLENETLYLWALRFSFARGWQWVKQREVSIANAEAWLKNFKKDEPEIEFQISKKAPKITSKKLASIIKK